MRRAFVRLRLCPNRGWLSRQASQQVAIGHRVTPSANGVSQRGSDWHLAQAILTDASVISAKLQKPLLSLCETPCALGVTLCPMACILASCSSAPRDGRSFLIRPLLPQRLRRLHHLGGMA